MTEENTEKLSSIWQLSSTARQALKAESSAFWIRAECAFQIMERIKGLNGGRGKSDTEGKGRVAVFKWIARRIGISLSAFYKDVKIYRVFASSLNADETIILRNNGLSRGFYVAALEAPDPQAAISYASNKRRSNPSYKVKDFKKDLQKLWPEMAVESKEQPQPIRVALTPTALTALGGLTSEGFYARKSYPAVVEAALVHLREQQDEKRTKERIPAVITSSPEPVVKTVRKDLTVDSQVESVQ